MRAMSKMVPIIGATAGGGPVAPSLAPHLRDPVNGYDTAARGNVDKREWINQTSGEVFTFSTATGQWSSVGTPSLYPLDVVTAQTNDAVLAWGTKALTASLPGGLTALGEVYPLDKAGTAGSLSALPVIGLGATARTLQGSTFANAKGLSAIEKSAVYDKQLRVATMANQVSGTGNLSNSGAHTTKPIFWALDGVLDGSGSASNWVNFNNDRNGIHPVMSALGTVKMASQTVYIVVWPQQAGDFNVPDPGVYCSSAGSVFGWTICAPSRNAALPGGAGAQTGRWRLVQNVTVGGRTDIAGPLFSCTPSILSLSFRVNGSNIDYEFACNDSITTGSIPLSAIGGDPNTAGQGLIFGNAGPAALAAASACAAQGGAIVCSTGHTAAQTKAVRRAFMRSFGIVPQAFNDNIMFIGDSSGAEYMGSTYPLIGYDDTGTNRLADQGFPGLGTQTMMHPRMGGISRYCRLNFYGVSSTNYGTWETGSANHIAFLQKLHDAAAANNVICMNFFSYKNGGTGTTADGDAAFASFSSLLSTIAGWGLANVRIVVGKYDHAALPASDVRFFALLEANKNALALPYTTFTFYDVAQVDAWIANPLYIWAVADSSGHWSGHQTPLLYSKSVDSNIAAINARLT